MFDSNQAKLWKVLFHAALRVASFQLEQHDLKMGGRALTHLTGQLVAP